MIKIVHFPETTENLTPILSTLHHKLYYISTEWYYNSEEELNVDIHVEGEGKDYTEEAICAFLSSKKFQYYPIKTTKEPQSVMFQHHYILSPFPNNTYDRVYKPNFDSAALCILLTGIKKSEGRFIVKVCNDGNTLKACIQIHCNSCRIPYDIEFAFGNRFHLAESNGLAWFYFSEESYADLLSLPYSNSTGNALVHGYGTKEQAIQYTQQNDVVIGQIFNDTLYRSLCFTKNNWTSSSYVVGAPGYGKSTLLNSVLYQAWKKQGISFLVIEPKREYRCLKTLIPEMKVIKSLVGYNPLVPPLGTDPYDYAEVVIELINLCENIPNDSPIAGYYRQAYYRAIHEGNFYMKHFIQLYLDIMKNQEFNTQAINFIISGKNRLETFFRIFCGPDFMNMRGKAFNINELLNKPTVIEIGKTSTQRILTVYTYFVIAHLKLNFQLRESSHVITNALVIEEAHTVLSPDLSATLRTDIINLIAEGRAKGLSVMICDQSPSRLDQSATNLCGNSISFRLMSTADRDYVSTQLDCNSEELNRIHKHHCLIRTNNMYACEKIDVQVPNEILKLHPLSDKDILLMDIQKILQIDLHVLQQMEFKEVKKMYQEKMNQIKQKQSAPQ